MKTGEEKKRSWSVCISWLAKRNWRKLKEYENCNNGGRGERGYKTSYIWWE